ncbi:MAG: BBE domain-containing protein [Geodermatophilaceae bacterium]|nr:BBE domain-containing protein [Geodermatophilaceae bacterium]
MQALKPYSTRGTWVNLQTDDEPDERTRASYGDDLDQLRAVKSEYDPANLFRLFIGGRGPT